MSSGFESLSKLAQSVRRAKKLVKMLGSGNSISAGGGRKEKEHG